MSKRKPMAATAQIVHLMGLEIARGPAPDMNRQTSIGAGFHQRGVGILGLAFGLSARLVFAWKLGIDGLVRVRADLKIGAMMVGIVAIFISAMRRHELDHLQRALRAVDVRNLHIGFLFLIE